MSKLLDEALERYQQFKESTPPIAPPRDKYTYEEACFTMWHDGCNNTYSNIIYLIKKYEQPELTEEQEKYYQKLHDNYRINCGCQKDLAVLRAIADSDLRDNRVSIPALRKFLNEVAE